VVRNLRNFWEIFTFCLALLILLSFVAEGCDGQRDQRRPVQQQPAAEKFDGKRDQRQPVRHQVQEFEQ
jgi:hypothetical protein